MNVLGWSLVKVGQGPAYELPGLEMIMPSNLLDELAKSRVPPVPPEFRKRLHTRLNRLLTALHVLDLFVRAMPWAILGMLRALGGFVHYTLTGTFPKRSEPESRES